MVLTLSVADLANQVKRSDTPTVSLCLVHDSSPVVKIVLQLKYCED